MRLKNISKVDIKYHYKQNSGFYFAFLVFVFIGLAVGIIIVCGGDGYIKILTSDSKVLYHFINGTANSSSIFWQKFLYFFVPLILIFLMSLNYYVSLASFILVAYQSSMLVISSAALITLYGFSGVLNVLLLMLPVNIIYLSILISFGVFCLSRSKEAHICKNFAYGINSDWFWIKLASCVLGVMILAFVATVILPMFLKNAIFIIY